MALCKQTRSPCEFAWTWDAFQSIGRHFYASLSLRVFSYCFSRVAFHSFEILKGNRMREQIALKRLIDTFRIVGLEMSVLPPVQPFPWPSAGPGWKAPSREAKHCETTFAAPHLQLFLMALCFGPAFGSGFLGSSSNQKLTLRRSNMCSLHSLHCNRSKLSKL